MRLILNKEATLNKFQSNKYIKSLKFSSFALLGLTGFLISSNALSADVWPAEIPKSNIKEDRKIKSVYGVSNNSSTFNSNDKSRMITIKSKTDAPFGTDVKNNEDSIGKLIKKKEVGRFNNLLNIEQRTRIIPRNEVYHKHSSDSNQIINSVDFSQWLNQSSYRVSEVKAYEKFLRGHVGAKNVPPMNQLLTTARSWADCGYEPYQVPPRELWTNMVLTLRLFNELKAQGILPDTTEIRSVYRSPELNACAGGAATSKHMTNAAIDVWVPEYEDNPWFVNPMKDKLCQFWATQGESYNLGLGLYATGAIHLDTQGYRMWGAQYTDSYSPCRYVNQ